MDVIKFILWFCLIFNVNCIHVKRDDIPRRLPKSLTKTTLASSVNQVHCSEKLVKMARFNLIGCSVVYGSNYVASKALLKTIPPDLLNVFRFIIPFFAFLPTVLSLSDRKRPTLVGLELGVFCAIGFIAQSIALQRASSNKVAFFISLGVLMPPLFDSIGNLGNYLPWNRLDTKEQVSRRRKHRSMLLYVANSRLIPPILAICGACILEFSNGVDPAKVEDILLLLTPLSFAFCFYRSGMHASITASLPISEELKLQTTKFITAIMMLTTSVLSSAYACYTGQFPLTLDGWRSLGTSITSNWKTVVLLLYTGVVCTGWTAISEQKALRVLSSGDIAMIYTLEPLFASFFGVLLLKEVVTRNICIGATFILAACLYPTLIDNMLNRSNGALQSLKS